MSMMDDEDDVIYRSNGPIKNDSYPREVVNSDDENDDEEEDENEKAINDGQDEDEDNDDDDDDGGNGVQRISKDDYEYGDEEENNDDADNGDQQRHPKKRKLKNLISSYEFAPRIPAAPSPTAPKPSYGGRNPLTDWTERESMVLLDAWGDRFLKHGRKSLRSEEWQEVAEKVSRESRIERTDTQCRNRLDTLKKKYKKEKMKLGDAASEWVYFKKIDALLSPQVQQTGLSCGVDSGEYVFMNPKVYLDRSNGLDEMMDSPGNSTDGEEDESDGLPPKKTKIEKTKGSKGSFKMLADSFQKFSEIYERIENNKREQMVELEKVRMEFHRDLELQKREIIERAQAEIAKIRMGEDEAENISG